MYVYVCLHTFCNRSIFLLCALGTPWANYGGAMPQSGKNTVKPLVYYIHCKPPNPG